MGLQQGPNAQPLRLSQCPTAAPVRKEIKREKNSPPPPRQLPWCELFGPASKVPVIFLFSNGGFNLGASCGGKILA
jgi:hypothetical protein